MVHGQIVIPSVQVTRYSCTKKKEDKYEDLETKFLCFSVSIHLVGIPVLPVQKKAGNVKEE